MPDFFWPLPSLLGAWQCMDFLKLFLAVREKVGKMSFRNAGCGIWWSKSLCCWI